MGLSFPLYFMALVSCLENPSPFQYYNIMFLCFAYFITSTISNSEIFLSELLRVLVMILRSIEVGKIFCHCYFRHLRRSSKTRRVWRENIRTSEESKYFLLTLQKCEEPAGVLYLQDSACSHFPLYLLQVSAQM